MNSSLPSLAMGKLVKHDRHFTLDKSINQGEGKALNLKRKENLHFPFSFFLFLVEELFYKLNYHGQKIQQTLRTKYVIHG